jgi:hypothetical protein
MQGDEFGYPGIAELAHVGRGIARHGGQELLVRRSERQALHLDVQAGVLTLEVWQQRAHLVGLGAKGPELQHFLVRRATTAADHQGRQ